jgi:muramoyltetrapeptide carboxypeptidase
MPQKKVESCMAGALLLDACDDKGEKMVRIAVIAPSCPLKPEAADAVQAIAAARGDCEIVIHPQCFLSEGHFAGGDDDRLAALREVMTDPSVNAIWSARGGYGSNRIAEAAVTELPDAAREKLFMGFSDSGFLHAGLHKAGMSVVWGPMPQDVLRNDGEAAVARALDWMVRRDPSALEPKLSGPAVAFNLTVLSNLLGTPLEPDLSGAELLIEEVSEHLYRIDRTMFHVTASPNIRKVRQIRLGRVADIPANDPAFGIDAEAIVRDWCARSGIPFGGSADIGHDADNRVVPFGLT